MATTNVVCAQHIIAKEYIVLNQVMPDILRDKNNIKEDSLALYVESLLFINQQLFFLRKLLILYN
ncbi:hypothetical protein [Flavobacterium sp. TAB 87]|uniref:hypothetical protein n=1 Tax=Flavobacterium sp. TAB 87 TaxID=1729581 RepID=UPI00076CD157|nr:hypothetical protein [Flavobacterium sp. TAB 87]KVV14141.1 hypothetical protein AP058_02027 [Flavobacterium sp. TAB 87]